jgi:membrane protease YdiL (CAAX protease family)
MRKNPLTAFIFVFIIWSFYRFLNLGLPVWLEEILIKGIIFSSPLILFPINKKPILQAVGITRVNFFRSVYLGIAIGMVLGLAGQVGNLLRHGEFSFQTYGITSATIGSFLMLSLITAFWEQLLFTGYFLSRISSTIKSEINQSLLIGAGFSLIHLPALVLNHSTPAQISLNLLLLFSLGVSCVILRLRMKNLIAPIMIHALWGVTIFLFR